MPALPAAKQGDRVQAMDTHIVMVPSPGGPVPTPTPGHPFSGISEKTRSHHQLQRAVQRVFKRPAMDDACVFTQLEHAPQHRHLLPADARGQEVEGGADAGRVGVVAVHDDREVANAPDLGAHASSLNAREATDGIPRTDP